MSKPSVPVPADDGLTEEQRILVTEFSKLPPAVQERRILIRDLLRRGIPIAQIAKVANVSVDTIERDVAWFRRIAAKFIDHYSMAEDIGNSVEFYQEVEDKAMENARAALEDRERPVKIKDPETGEVVDKMVSAPDDVAATHWTHIAMTARKNRIELMQKVGMMKVVPERKEIAVGHFNIADLRTNAELVAANASIAARIAETRARIAAITGGSGSKAGDSNE